MSDKYLRRNNFKYDTSPNVMRHDGRGHVAYVTAKYKHKSKVNIITHSNTFLMNLLRNYQKTRIGLNLTFEFPVSVPRWENNKHLKPINTVITGL